VRAETKIIPCAVDQYKTCSGLLSTRAADSVRVKSLSSQERILYDEAKIFLNSLLKAISILLFIVCTLQATSQTTKDYIKLLTADLRQTWRLDSITMNSNYSEFKKEMVVLFKLDNQAIVYYDHAQKKDTISWYLEKKDRYALLRLGDLGQYEIDFLERNHQKYMRLRNEIPLEKNINIIEYFFKPSTL